jgi:hypothetical protein
MYALDAQTGRILWSFASGGSVIDGPSIVNGVLYWGSGYRRIGGIGNNKLYAFSVLFYESPGLLCSSPRRLPLMHLRKALCLSGFVRPGLRARLCKETY